MMLADTSPAAASGQFARELHLPLTAKAELVSFIARKLPGWRDHPDRPREIAETGLTEQLCSYLNEATYTSAEWHHIRFQTEIADEARKGRKVDLAAKPRATVLHVAGRRHTIFDALFPIECKRLPTPREKGRDEREYVVTARGSTGGIQRFKFGYHGAAHAFAAMIAYVQERTAAHWAREVNAWIRDLAAEPLSRWSESDFLHAMCDDPVAGVCSLASRHRRPDGSDELELRHLWIQMDSGRGVPVDTP